MNIEKYTRKPFDVDAVLVTFETMEDIANWCRGRVGSSTYKIRGQECQLNCVQVPEAGVNSTQYSNAQVGDWIVRNKGHFRIYRPAAFFATFMPNPSPQTFEHGDKVTVINEHRTEYGWIGEVKKSVPGTVVVDFINFSAFGKKYKPEELRIENPISDKILAELVEYAKVDAELTQGLFGEELSENFFKGDRVKVTDLGRGGLVFVTAHPQDPKVSVLLDDTVHAKNYDRDQLKKIAPVPSNNLNLSMFSVGEEVTISNEAHTQQGRIGKIEKVEWQSGRGCWVYTVDFVTENEDGQEFRGVDFEQYKTKSIAIV